MTAPRPPRHVAPYVEALGADVAVRFFLDFGGTELYIPRNPKSRSPVAKALGRTAAQALSDLADRVMLPDRVPIPKEWIAQHLAITKALSHAEIARTLHVTRNTVSRYLAGVPEARPAEPPSRQASFGF
jgi:hypothetical protein